MNNENNNVNTEPVVNQVPTTSVVPNTTPVANKFMAVNDVNQINQPVNNVPNTAPVVQQPVQVVPTTEVITTPPTQVVPAPQPTVDNNAMINENLQKVEIKNYTPPSKFKIFLLIVFFLLLIAFIMFLPDISSQIRIYMSGANEPVEKEVITTGKLICSLSTNTTDLDKEYEFEFSYTDSKLKTTKYVVYTRGDTTTETVLDELAEKCKTLKANTEEIEGVSVKCEYSDGKLMEKQIFELEKIDTEKLDAAFTEAGGLLPSYKYDQEIDGIEKNMKASNYSCERQK